MGIKNVATSNRKIKSTRKSEVSMKNEETLILNIKKHGALYIMIIPGLLFLIVFKFIPMFGSVIAFQDYDIFKGIGESSWVGFKHFESFVKYHEFRRIFTNTIIIGVYKLGLSFPVPIILALMMNEIGNKIYKKSIQTIFYIPHFFSWVIIAGLTFTFLSQDGFVNSLRGIFGAEPILFMQQTAYFRTIVVLTYIWRDAGWGTIVLLAAMSGIDPQVYESAMIDGAGRIRRVFSITLPLILPTVVILFMLKLGTFLELGFEHIYNLITPMTYSVGDIIDTYIYRVGVLGGQYSRTTAIGLMQAFIGFTMVFSFNKLAKKISDSGGLW